MKESKIQDTKNNVACGVCGIGVRIPQKRLFKPGMQVELYTSICNHCGFDAPTSVQHTANLWLLHKRRK